MPKLATYAILVIGFLGLSTCSRKYTYRVITNGDDLDSLGIPYIYGSETEDGDPCDDPLHYIPDTSDTYLNLKRTLRYVLHIMNSGDSLHNFGPEEAPSYFWTMFENAMERLAENHPMNLPAGNQTPALPPYYDYLKVAVDDDDDPDGIMYHYDDDLYYFLNRGRFRNNYRKDVIFKYAVGGDTVLNVFVMPHHPDSTASVTYKAHGSGIALGNSVKVAGIFENGGPSWKYATLINHEIGHVLGLKHAWLRRDGCEDTPTHPNCYYATGEPPCEGPTSNNMMDYNNSQMAITPCQLGIIHRNFNEENSLQRKLLVRNWCELDTGRVIQINEEKHWKGERDIVHSITINPGGSLHLYCRVSMPEGGKIMVLPGGSLYLHSGRIHNDCGGKWQGIVVVERGDEKGLVEYETGFIITDVSHELDR